MTTASHRICSTGFFIFAVCLLVTSANAGTVNVLNTFTLPDGVDSVQDAAWDGNSVWVADVSTTVLYEIDPSDGSVLSQIDHPGGNPFGLTSDGTNLFVGDLTSDGNRGPSSDQVFEITTAGATVNSWATPDSPDSAPAGLAYDGTTGNLWLADDISTSNTVYELNADDGSVISSFSYPGGTELRGITWRNGQLFAIADENLQILQLDSSGNILGFASIAELGSNPRGITWDGNSFWVTVQGEMDDEPGELVQLTATFSSNASTPVPALSPVALIVLSLFLGVVAFRLLRSRKSL